MGSLVAKTVDVHPLKRNIESLTVEFERAMNHVKSPGGASPQPEKGKSKLICPQWKFSSNRKKLTDQQSHIDEIDLQEILLRVQCAVEIPSLRER